MFQVNERLLLKQSRNLFSTNMVLEIYHWKRHLFLKNEKELFNSKAIMEKTVVKNREDSAAQVQAKAVKTTGTWPAWQLNSSSSYIQSPKTHPFFFLSILCQLHIMHCTPTHLPVPLSPPSTLASPPHPKIKHTHNKLTHKTKPSTKKLSLWNQ